MYGIKITEVLFSNTLDYYKGWVEKKIIVKDIMQKKS